jgi:branched-chain amino acid transport system ATP-binding protein
MLELRALKGGYGETQVVHGIDLVVQPGQFHAILGRNGAGKSTTLKTIVGHLRPFGGEIIFKGAPLHGAPAHVISRHGIAYVPETRDIFGSLSVLENLQLAARLSAGPDSPWSVARVLSFFPHLAARIRNGGNQLSGGEQQMLAIGRALVMNPDLLILDEPTEGLAPIIVRQILEKLRELKAEGMTVLLVEQNVSFAMRLADQISLFGRGECVWTGTPGGLADDRALQERWLGV